MCIHRNPRAGMPGHPNAMIEAANIGGQKQVNEQPVIQEVQIDTNPKPVVYDEKTNNQEVLDISSSSGGIEFVDDTAQLDLIDSNATARKREKEFHEAVDEMISKIVQVKHYFVERKKIEQLAAFAMTFQNFDKLPPQ